MQRARRAALVALGLLTLAFAACGDDGGDSSGTITPSPAVTINPSNPFTESSVTATPPPPDSDFSLVYREFGETADTIWTVNPVSPSERTEVVTIAHRPGYGIVPSLSPDGRLLAYLTLPENAPADPTLSRADLFLMDLTTGRTEKLLEFVDLMFAPLWDPGSRYLYVRQRSGPDPLSVDVILTQITIPEQPAPGATPTPTPSPTPTPTPTPAPTGDTPTSTPGSPTPSPTPFNPVREILRDSVSRVLDFRPIGFGEDNERLFFVQVSGGTLVRTVLGSYAPATTESIATTTAFLDATATALSEQSPTPSPTPQPNAPPTPTPTPVAKFVVELADQLITSPHLNPRGTHVSYLVPTFVGNDVLERTYVADLANRVVTPLSVEGLPSGTHVNPVWHPDNQRLSIGFERSGGGTGAVALVPVTGGALQYLPGPAGGYDEPVSWSPDARFLAVEHHLETGQARLDLVSPAGQRGTVQNNPDYRILGWYRNGSVPIPPAPEE